ncbi:hypothetical protein [Saccharothrix algeriensis]|uniref:Uncharacterized protein n=1 Tax=Saccharothrix algeriensis TaxID=173560 RepID=A0ABS2SCT9_9PSEU|nr:hypothetical protein [Saccharothrix algeriensis]MBM7813780.1 hypothetical protein [Saccharothrix algeriensis]
MRKFLRMLAVAGVAAAALSTTGVASATTAAEAVVTGTTTTAAATTQADQQALLDSCSLHTNNTTFAYNICSTSLQYRIVVSYCRATCVDEYGAWVTSPSQSRVDFPSGGTITNFRTQFK